MIKLSYHFKCDIPGCLVESTSNIGNVAHRMHIPDLPIPNGWHYLDHRIVCNGHSVVIDKKSVDAPTCSKCCPRCDSKTMGEISPTALIVPIVSEQVNEAKAWELAASPVKKANKKK